METAARSSITLAHHANLEPHAIDLLWILACLAGSAFFSGAETALTSLTEPQRARLVEGGGAGVLRVWEEHPQRVLTATLIGNTLMNITVAVLATAWVDRWLEPTAWALALSLAVTAAVVLTFGEVAPKAVAQRYHQRWAAPAMWALMVPYLLLYPVTLVFLRLTRGLLRILGSHPSARRPFVTAEEIEYMIDVAAGEGSFTEERERLLRSVMDFRDTTVRELMVPRTDIEAIDRQMSLDEILEVMVRCGHSRLPVYEGEIDHIVGLFYAKDVLVMIDAGQVASFDMDQFMRRAHFVPEHRRAADLLGEFQTEKMHMAIVVDEFGGTAGVITLEDIVEEIFGDIQDEYDAEPAQIVRLDASTARVDARASIDDVEAQLGLTLPDHPDYESVGGFLMKQSGGVPEVGDEVECDGVRFRVLDADGRRVNLVLIEQTSAEALDESSRAS